MSTRIINTVEEMKEMLASHIAEDSKREVSRKFKFSSWRNGLTRLIELSEHGWELIDFEIAEERTKAILLDGWRKNRFGEPVGRKTAAQIAKLLEYDLTTNVINQLDLKVTQARNSARNSITHYQREIDKAVVEANDYFAKRYIGVLEGLPRGSYFEVSVKLVDADGNVCKPELTEE
jgi:hypothetical protein